MTQNASMIDRVSQATETRVKLGKHCQLKLKLVEETLIGVPGALTTAKWEDGLQMSEVY